MLGIKFIKFDANTYVIHYKKGQVKSEGRGLSFWYYSPTSSIAAIPMGSDDAPFIFQDTTNDFQKVTIQGQITFKIENPKQLADLLDYSVDSDANYIRDDYEKLAQRLMNEAQTSVKNYIQNLSIREAINSSKELEKHIFEGLSNSSAVAMLGIKTLGVSVLGVSPSPEMARALEAETREAVQQEADEAIYDRRNFAVEQERKIKESELSTEIAVEEKKKQIAEKKMETDIAKAENNRKLREMKVSADIAIEDERKSLIDLQSENQKKQSDAQAYKLQKMLGEYKKMDWKVLMAMQSKGTNAQEHIALAFRELAENAQQIGTLNITPDLLQSLTNQSNS